MLTVRGWQLLVAEPVAVLDSLAALDRYAAAVGWRGATPDGPPFRGGAVGFLTDDLNSELLALPADHRPPTGTGPGMRFTVHDWCLAVAPDGRAWAVAAPDRIPLLRQMAMRWPAGIASSPGPHRARTKPEFGMTRAAHHAAVEQILEWIAAGDLYQTNLTFQVRAPWTGTPQALARALQAATPGAAHAAVLTGAGDGSIVSVSPETFLRTSGDRITTRPIKGTRRRDEDAAADAAAAQALRASAKDQAEHVMIVDLARNDLGRVCDPGSVTVERLAELEGHPTVWHLTSTISGRMRNGATLSQVLAATFPPGSVTGTPKRMAVARARLLEPVRRGVYCGAVGIVGPGLLDLSVAIRTAVVTGGVASYGTGGGIVADSTPEAEHDEAMAKAAAFLTATGTAQQEMWT